MRKSIPIYVTMAVGMSIGGAFSSSVSAQVPEPRSAPQVAPARGALAAPQDQAAPAVLPPGQPSVAPTAAAPTEPAPVSVAPAPSGVTQLPPAAAPPATASSSAAATKDTRAYSATNFALTLDGVHAGFLRAVEGGAALADVVVEKMGPDNISKKHVAGVEYEELSFEVGFDSRPVTDWITSSWKGSFVKKSGGIQLADLNYDVRGERQFMNALITGTTIPALDAGSKEAAHLTVTIAPESIREMAASGKVPSNIGKGQKQWLPSNFRFELGDLPGNRVSRIESFTVGQKAAGDQVGELREFQKQAGTLVFPDLKVTLSQADASPWAKWHEEFVIKGMNGDAQEKNGAIVFLDNTMKGELGRISLFNCGIFRFGAVRREANADKVARVTADLYCERMEFVGNAAAK